MTRAKDISKIVTDADLSGTLDVTGTVTAGGLKSSVSRTSGANATAITLSDNVTGAQTSGFGTRIVATSNSNGAVSAIGFEADGGTNNDTAISLYTQPQAGLLRQRFKASRYGDISFYEDTGTTPKLFWQASTERLGIGTASPNATLQVDGTLTVRSSSSQIFNDSSNANNLTMNDSKAHFNLDGADKDFQVSSDNNTHALFVQGSDGNVGIGTASPSETLDVSGDAKATRLIGRQLMESSSGVSSDTFSVVGGTSGNSSTNHGGVFFSKHVDSYSLLVGTHDATFNSFVVKGNGNVGIGTNSPSAKLDVTGAIEADDKITIAYEAGSSDWELESTSGDDFTISRNGSQYFMIDGSTNNVGIGTTNPLNLLQVAGAIGLSNAVMASATTSGDFAINISNQFALSGSNWRQSGLLLFYQGIDTGQSNSIVLFTSIRLRGLSTWSSLVQSNIIGTASISDSNASSTGLTITVDVPDSNNGIVFVLVLGTNKPTVSITG